MGLLPRHVEHRRTVDVDPDGPQLRRDQPVAQPHRRDPPRAVGKPLAFVERRQPLPPGRRPQPRDAPALLVDQDRRVAPDRVAQVGRQPAPAAPGSSTLRPKRMKPQGSAAAKKGRSSGESTGPAQPRMTARAAIYCSVTGMQSMPRARSASHISRVWSVLVKPATRSR